jgi:hypothetical protein
MGESGLPLALRGLPRENRIGPKRLDSHSATCPFRIVKWRRPDAAIVSSSLVTRSVTRTVGRSSQLYHKMRRRHGRRLIPEIRQKRGLEYFVRIG